MFLQNTSGPLLLTSADESNSKDRGAKMSLPNVTQKQVFLQKGVLKIGTEFTGEHPMLKCDFNKIAKQGCSPVNQLHIFRTPFPKSWFPLR